MSVSTHDQAELEAVLTAPEKFRPHYHYTANQDWLSDPNGMVYFNGQYHLCYQHDDYDKVFGAMSWGHAVSTDLLNWQERPKVITPDETLGMCFSGCMVVDKNNTSGLGHNTLIGFYTSELPKQQQSMFYSTDAGQTFTKYENNPVIRNTPEMSKDFRDPKVMWYEPKSLWVMSLAGPERIEFWSSPNLIDWQLESVFGEGYGAHGGEWECPDLRCMPIDGEEENLAWVLLVSVNPGGPNGGCGTQYFVGQFADVEGKLTFTANHTEEKWLDWGIDNYAGIAWSNLEDSPWSGRVFSIGWMNNWLYAYKTPTAQWRGVMTLIRELKLETFHCGLILTCRPASIYQQLVGVALPNQSEVRMNQATRIGTSLNSSRVCLELRAGDADDVGVEFSNELGEVTRVGYDRSEGAFYVDRRYSGNEDFAEHFAGRHTARVERDYDQFSLEIYLDRCSIEVFFNKGEVAMSELIYPEQPLSTIKPYGGNHSEFSQLSIERMGRIKRL